MAAIINLQAFGWELIAADSGVKRIGLGLPEILFLLLPGYDPVIMVIPHLVAQIPQINSLVTGSFLRDLHVQVKLDLHGNAIRLY